MTQSASLSADRTLGFGDGIIGWPYGLMYQIREMGEGRVGTDVGDLWKRMEGFRREGCEPG